MITKTTQRPQPVIDVEALAKQFGTFKYQTGHAATEAARQHVRGAYAEARAYLSAHTLERLVMPVALAWNGMAAAEDRARHADWIVDYQSGANSISR